MRWLSAVDMQLHPSRSHKVAVGSTPAQRRDGERIGVDFLGEQGDGCVGGLADDFG